VSDGHLDKGDRERAFLNIGVSMTQDMQTRVHHLVERTARMTPSAVAIRTPEGVITYQELDDRAGLLASNLRRHGVGSGSVVGMSLSRGADVAVALLGILKAGAAYLPMDAALPVSRQEDMLSAASARVVLTPEKAVGGYTSDALQVLPLASLCSADRDAGMGEGPRTAFEAESGHDALAYVIFTSGSSGRPKPVAVGHRGLVRHATAIREAFQLTPADRVLQFHDISFDAAAEELYPAWTAGAELVMLAEKPSYSAVSGIVRDLGITVLSLSTGYWHQLTAELRTEDLPDLSSLRVVVVGGEAVSADVANSWLRRFRVPILNTYGTSETTISNTVYLMRDREPGTHFPIGKPIAGTSAYVLDDALHAVPAGEPGELFLGGEGVAWGYLGLQARTAESFLPDPFAAVPGSRLYRTGDIVQLRPDGELDFLGRADDQMKIRGYRVEPGEIETALTSLEPVAVACVRPSALEPDQVIAYLVLTRDGAMPGSAELRKALARRLPAYMIPDRYICVRELPLNQHGKIDRGVLASLETSNGHAAVPTSAGQPASDRTSEVVRIWEEVLGVSGLELDANFFELGGHSLLIFKILSRIESGLGISLPVRAVFDTPVLEDFIASVEQTSAT
jgi:amino acid adenylation domain-containing protein